MFPFILPEKKSKKEEKQERLYIEIPFVEEALPASQDKADENERGVIIIDIINGQD